MEARSDVLECILSDRGRGSDSLAVAGPSYAGGLGDWERSGMMRAAPCCVHGEGMLERMGIGRECRSTESEANACPPRVVNSQRVYWPASPTSKDNSLKIRYHNAFGSREMMFAGVNIDRETEGRRGMTGREWKTMQKGASVNNAVPKPGSESFGDHVRLDIPRSDERRSGRENKTGETRKQ